MSQSDMLEELKNLLAELDEPSIPTSEAEIGSKLRGSTGDHPKDQLPWQWRAELMAFGFCEDYRDKATGWGTYFGPFSVLRNEDGTWSEAPSIKLVDDQVLAVQSHDIMNTRS